MKLRTRLESIAWLGGGMIVGLTAWALIFGVPSSAPPEFPNRTFEQPAAATATTKVTTSPSASPSASPMPAKAPQKLLVLPADEPVDTTSPPPAQDTYAPNDPAVEPMVTDDVHGPMTFAPVNPSPKPSESTMLPVTPSQVVAQ